jgi:hypothetical protein
VPDDTERHRLLNEIRRLRLAESDMNQVAAAANALHNERLNGDLCRALETAIAVCYARPYGSSNKVGGLGDEWLPEDPSGRALHDALLRRRDQVYAHTDRTDARDIVDIFGDGTFAEEWRPLSREALPRIIVLVAHQQTRFREGVEERQAALRSLPPPSASA